MIVKIKTARKGTWYERLAEAEFDVIVTADDYIVKEKNSPVIKHIRKQDCVIVSSGQKPTKTLL